MSLTRADTLAALGGARLYGINGDFEEAIRRTGEVAFASLGPFPVTSPHARPCFTCRWQA